MFCSSFPVISLPCFGNRNLDFIEWVENFSFLFNFVEEFVLNWYYLFFKRLLKFSSEIIWAWSLLIGVFLNYIFNSFNRYESIQGVYLWVNFGSFCLGRNLPLSPKLLLWLTKIFICYYLNNHLIFIESIVMSLLSFLIFLILFHFSWSAWL